MTRYVMANRRAGLFQTALKQRSRDAANRAWDALAGDADLVGDVNPDDELARRVVVFDADAADVAGLPDNPDVIVEPEILRYPTRAPLPPDLRPDPGVVFGFDAASPLAAGTPFAVKLIGAGQPIPNVDVTVVVVLNGRRSTIAARTDRDGIVTVTVPAGAEVYALVAEPYAGWWPTVTYRPADGAVVSLAGLPTGAVGWWAGAVGARTYQWNAGSGIIVGVADTGCGPHPALANIHPAGAFIAGRVDSTPDAVHDVDVHGSHVSGTIAGRGRPGGIAPGCQLWAARVFPGPDQGASQADIVNAVDNLSRTHQAHLVNLSLGSAQSSRIEHDAIVDAAERGTLVVCAAGNDAGPVGYPAFYDEAVAVAAVGRDGSVPPFSVSGQRAPADTGSRGRDGWWLANFSDRGAQVDVAAPGVGVVATVPAQSGRGVMPYTAMDGTSMASPVAVAVLAVVLSRDPKFRRMPRDRSRTERARQLLGSKAVSVGLAAVMQGAGLAHF